MVPDLLRLLLPGLRLLISIICCFIFKSQTLFGKIQHLSIKGWLKFMSCHESIIVNLSSCIVHLLLQHCFQILFMSSLNVKIVWSFALISISCDNKKDNLKILIYEVGKSLWHNMQKPCDACSYNPQSHVHTFIISWTSESWRCESSLFHSHLSSLWKCLPLFISSFASLNTLQIFCSVLPIGFITCNYWK